MYIYQTTNLINGKQYIGQSIQPPEESKGYYGSGTALKSAIKKYGGKDNFKKEILIDDIKTQEELDTLEIWVIDFLNTKSPFGYNIKEGGCGGKHSDETKKKLSDANKGRIPWNKGKKLSDETKKKMRKPKSGAHKKKMSDAQKGKKLSEKHKKKISESHKGKKYKRKNK